MLKTKDQEIMVDQSFGLLSQEVTCLIFDSIHNFLWIGTTKGLHSIDLNDLYYNLQLIPNPYFVIEGQNVIWDSTIQLKAGIKSYSIQYDALDLSPFIKLKFRYRINSSEWNYSNVQNLDLVVANPGIYKIEISSSNAGFIWAEPLTLTLDKSPFFWQTWLFRILVVMIVLIVVFKLIQRRFRRIKQLDKEKRDKEKQIEEYQFKAVSASINPHFVFNSLNSLQYLVNSKNPKTANQYISYFARLLRINIDDIDRPFVSLEREIERVNQYLGIEKIRYGEKLSYSIKIDPEIDASSQMIPGMIIQPFVENSIKHGFRTQEIGDIQIKISLEANWIKITIIDNGEGEITRKNQPTGKGNKLVSNRLRVIYNMPEQEFVKVISKNNEEGSGYKVEISIPK